jgi:ubiquinone/menaquinone biosynthesis C-methylase UbiE
MTRSWTPPEPIARKAQAEKIHAILCNYLQSDLAGKRCLEVGCGNGEIINHLAKHTSQAMGLEINGRILRSNLIKDSRVVYIQGDGRQLPFEDDTFDIVILAQVYEHMTRQEMLSAEVYRVLKPGGVCFFSGPNRWQVIEPHYFLPFLAWLPGKMASAYLRVMKRGDDFDIYSRGYFKLRYLWKNFEIVDFTWQMIKDPKKFSLNHKAFRKYIINKTPICVIKLIKPLYGNYNWVLVKCK